MFDFTSQYWTWFIVVPTGLGIVGLIWLCIGNTESKKSGDQTETVGHVWDEDLQEYNNPLPRWWLNLFYITIVFAIIYLILFPGLGTFKGVLGWTQTSQYEEEINAANQDYGPLFEKYAKEDLKALVKNKEAMKTGARLFSTYCTTCHGSDARGAAGFPNLRDHDWLFGGEPENIKTSIMNGRIGAMPPWSASLKEEEIFNVAEYVGSLSGRSADASVIEAGKQKFQQLCVACHGMEGKGNQALGAPNLADEIWLYGGSQRAIMESIANGRQGRMPAHQQFLGESKVHLLAAYVYSLSQDTAE
ncbi:MAG: cytochrome-c oxidase, cbb3-type subunit III [Gammaproteobacteria bacterium]|nr:cytochrome-c oxidase, cbb3-type subunit III [Gammaproteobacteria bacterium]